MAMKKTHTKPTSTMIPYGKHKISPEDINAVVTALKSDYITQGPLVKEFENALANYCGVRYVVAFSNGTAALHAASAAADLQPGDELLTSPISFVASSNCALYVGATPRFADIDLKSAQVTAASFEKALTEKTKVIMPVDLTGRPSEAENIWQLAKKHNQIVISDCAHSLGATYVDSAGEAHKAGSCAHADMSILSFHPVKSITTAEGGAVTTNNIRYYEKLLMFRTHGITKDPKHFVDKSLADKPWYYEMQELGFNYRLSDIQCALGISQLKILDEKIFKRAAIAKLYREKLAGTVEFLSGDDEKHQSAHHLFVILVPKEKRDDLMLHLKQNGISAQLHYYPIYRQPYYQKLFPNLSPKDFPNAENYWPRALSLPIYPELTDGEVEFVVEKIMSFLNL